MLRLRLPWRLKRSQAMLAVTATAGCTYFGGLILGLHPDGSILGVTGTFLGLYIAAVDHEENVRARERRDNESETTTPTRSRRKWMTKG